MISERVLIWIGMATAYILGFITAARIYQP